MRYDPAYTSTVATAIPVIFVALVVDLGLGRGSRTPRAALAVLSIVIVLLISELLCLNALSNHRELRAGESDLVAGAMLFSGLLVFFRVAGPLLDVARTHVAGRWAIGIGVAGFIVLWILKSQNVITGGTALVIFGMSVLFGGVIFPSIGAFISGSLRPRPYLSGQKQIRGRAALTLRAVRPSLVPRPRGLAPRPLHLVQCGLREAAIALLTPREGAGAGARQPLAWAQRAPPRDDRFPQCDVAEATIGLATNQGSAFFCATGA